MCEVCKKIDNKEEFEKLKGEHVSISINWGDGNIGTLELLLASTRDMVRDEKVALRIVNGIMDRMSRIQQIVEDSKKTVHEEPAQECLSRMLGDLASIYLWYGHRNLPIDIKLINHEKQEGGYVG